MYSYKAQHNIGRDSQGFISKTLESAKSLTKEKALDKI